MCFRVSPARDVSRSRHRRRRGSTSLRKLLASTPTRMRLLIRQRQRACAGNGKLRRVARGARRMKSRFGSALEPFVHCDLNLFEKHNDPLYRITQADIRETFPRLREDLAAMSGAARMVNLVAAVTAEGDPAPRIFQTLLGGLRWLQDGGDPALTALLFQLKLLGQTGFRPQTDHCAACGATFPDLRRDGAARFLPASGGL